MLWHINQTALVENPLSGNQHAFRSGMNTETALTSMASKIERALSKGEYALGVFLDIQGAFHNVNTEADYQAILGY